MITAKWILVTHLFAAANQPSILVHTAFEDKLTCLETQIAITEILEGSKHGVTECQPINHYTIGKAEVEKMMKDVK